ncbi:MAG: hypothetical protein RR980_02300 [Mucinivorans sp.]
MKPNSYKVPDGYFDELSRSILTKAYEKEQAELSSQGSTFAQQFRSAAVFAGSFVILVVLALTGYYFTARPALQQELAQSYDEMALIYEIDETDMVEYLNTPNQGQNTMYSDASYAYMEAFGYPKDIYEE